MDPIDLRLHVVVNVSLEDGDHRAGRTQELANLRVVDDGWPASDVVELGIERLVDARM